MFAVFWRISAAFHAISTSLHAQQHRDRRTSPRPRWAGTDCSGGGHGLLTRRAILRHGCCPRRPRLAQPARDPSLVKIEQLGVGGCADASPSARHRSQGGGVDRPGLPAQLVITRSEVVLSGSRSEWQLLRSAAVLRGRNQPKTGLVASHPRRRARMLLPNGCSLERSSHHGGGGWGRGAVLFAGQDLSAGRHARTWSAPSARRLEESPRAAGRVRDTLCWRHDTMCRPRASVCCTMFFGFDQQQVAVSIGRAAA